MVEHDLVDSDSPTLPDLEEVHMSQLEDADIAPLVAYLQNGTLPDEEKLVRRVLESRDF